VQGGGSFPERDLIIFLTFCIILITLVGQGLSLPPLLRLLGVTGDGADLHEEARARFRAIDAAMKRLEELAEQDWAGEAGVGYLRAYYEKRRQKLNTRFGKLDHEHSDAADGHRGHMHPDGADHLEDHRSRQDNLRRLRQELLDTERATVIQLRNVGAINDGVLRQVEWELDLEELQLAGSERPRPAAAGFRPSRCGQRICSRAATATASARVWARRRASTESTWLLTVLSLTWSRAAIVAFEQPCASRPRTS